MKEPEPSSEGGCNVDGKEDRTTEKSCDEGVMGYEDDEAKRACG